MMCERYIRGTEILANLYSSADKGYNLGTTLTTLFYFKKLGTLRYG